MSELDEFVFYEIIICYHR